VKHDLHWADRDGKMFHVKQDRQHFDSQSIASALADVGVPVTASQAVLLETHAALVLEANATMNLTRITVPRDVIELHIQDSLAPLSLIEWPTGPIVDIGSGAGYPGIPLAIMGYDLTLCESVKKKATFLSEAVVALGLHCSVVALRAEELAGASRGAFSVVTARAVSALPALVELATPLLSRDGCLIAMKGRLQAEEREQAERAAALCGMRCESIVEYCLPRGDRRTLCVYRKTGAAHISLPRRSGLAQRQPLGQLT